MRYNFFKNNNSISGFTMVELLVSISIVGLMAAMVAVNFRAGSSKGEVGMAAQKLASDIRQVQGYALSLKEFSSINNYPRGGWGIKFNKNGGSCVVFADYGDGSGGAINHKYDDAVPFSELFQEIKLVDGITVSDIQIDGVSGNNGLHLSFAPPDPYTYICGNAGQCDDSSSEPDAEIIIANIKGDTASVFINAFGLVDVQN